MKKYDKKLTPEAVLLNLYLNQYKSCIDRKKSLEGRRYEIMCEFDNPITGIRYDGMPQGNGEGLGCAALSFRLDEINTRIKEQIEKATKVLTSIMDMIDLLPDNSPERTIIEHRYIDRYSWEKICRIESMSRTPATRYWRKGLYDLLELEKVRKILEKYESDGKSDKA